MLDYQNFVKHPKSMLIAPAGYGKTYSIIECLKHTIGKQLILTHTHAGVAALKEKMRQSKIPNLNCNIETITSFSQKYVLAFYTGAIPNQENTKEYYPFILNTATSILRNSVILNIIKRTYTGLFVDEYQDCTIRQHNLVLVLSEVLPTRVIGDFMQGIFNFDSKSPMIDLLDKKIMHDFYDNFYSLDIPNRWIIGGNEALGEDLKSIRDLLINKLSINLKNFKHIKAKIIDNENAYFWQLKPLLDRPSLLLICSDSTSINGRLRLMKSLGDMNRAFTIAEAIDAKDFYEISKHIDAINEENYLSVIIDVCFNIFGRTCLKEWFNDTGFKRKKIKEEKDKSDKVKQLLCESIIEQSFIVRHEVVKSSCFHR